MTSVQLQKNWELNHNHNTLILSHLDESMLELSSRKQGRSITDILRHMAKNRFDWLKHLTPKLDYEIPDQKATDLESIFTLSYQWVEDLIIKEIEGTTVKGFKSDLFGFVIYLISHDSHHRGQIFQIIRDNGLKIDPKLQYGIWEWKYA